MDNFGNEMANRGWLSKKKVIAIIVIAAICLIVAETYMDEPDDAPMDEGNVPSVHIETPVTQINTPIWMNTLAAGADPTATVTLPLWKQLITPYPTLPFRLQDELYALLKTNGDCRLPCFLGIEPGVTNITDAKKILEKFDLLGQVYLDEPNSTPIHQIFYTDIHTTKDVSLVIRIRLEADEGVISRLVISTDASRDGYIAADDNHMIKYALREVFREHSPPEYIYFHFERGVFGLQIVYEKLKTVIDLSGWGKKNSDGSYSICPNIGEGFVYGMRIALAKPTDPNDIKLAFEYPFYESDRLIEITGGITISEFYNFMTSDEHPACFRIP